VAIGRLGSFKTSTTVGLNTNTVLYTSTGTLSKVTINVTNQGVEDATFSIGISSGTSFRDSDFIVYGQTIKKNTYVSITNVGISSGETIFTRANKENISFIANSVVDYDVSIGTFFGRQESVRTSLSGPALVNDPVVLYTAPKAAQVSISVNNTSQDDAIYSIGISSSGLSQFTSADYIIFGQSLAKRTTQIIDSIGIGTGQSIIVKANESDITFVAYDLPTSVLEKIIVSDAISIASSVTARGGFYGNLVGNVYSAGISTFNNGGVIIGVAGTNLIVNGDARITGILTIGTSSITLNGNSNTIKIGTGVSITNNRIDLVGILSATSINATSINATGVSTFNNVVVGAATTALVVNGNTTVTGIASIKDLVVTNSVRGSAIDVIDTNSIVYSIVFGS
jgi:hypothetical protein